MPWQARGRGEGTMCNAQLYEYRVIYTKQVFVARTFLKYKSWEPIPTRAGDFLKNMLLGKLRDTLY